MRRFAPDNLRKMFVNQLQDQPLENKTLVNAVTNAQKQIEGQNFDVRKNLLDYDDVLAKQRQIIYDHRDRIMMAEDIQELIHGYFTSCGKFLAKKAVIPGHDEGLCDLLKEGSELAES
jgi:preprotein translocase subunit SecA